MIYSETKLKGAFLIDIEPIDDERGWFSRTFCKNEFEKQGLCAEFVQHNISYSLKKGTIKGLHYQLPPYEEVKVVSCIKGKIFDVIVDMRPDSETYLKWLSVELEEQSGRMLYVPKGFAHGFQTLTDDVLVFYLMGELYYKNAENGLRWNDELLNISWPIREDIIISDKDRNLRTLN